MATGVAEGQIDRRPLVEFQSAGTPFAQHADAMLGLFDPALAHAAAATMILLPTPLRAEGRVRVADRLGQFRSATRVAAVRSGKNLLHGERGGWPIV